MYCPYCGTKCENTYRFCYMCGKELPSLPAAAAASPVEEPTPAAEPIPAAEVAPVEEPIPTEESAPIEPDNSAAEPVSIMPEVTAAAESLQENCPVPEQAAPVLNPHFPAPVCSQYFQPTAPTPIPTAVTPPVKKGRIWPPLLILGIMMTLGLLFFFLFPSIPGEQAPDIGSEASCFTVTDGVLMFDSSLYIGNGELEVPETIDGQTVTVIGEDCFKDCTKLTSVILPNTLTEIDDRAFSGCSKLRGIFIPEGVTRIGNSAFANCSSLEAIHLPKSIAIIGDRALFRCPKLVHVFYTGKYKDWEELYNGSMPNNAWVYCEDGNYPYTRD